MNIFYTNIFIIVITISSPFMIYLFVLRPPPQPKIPKRGTNQYLHISCGFSLINIKFDFPRRSLLFIKVSIASESVISATALARMARKGALTKCLGTEWINDFLRYWSFHPPPFPSRDYVMWSTVRVYMNFVFGRLVSDSMLCLPSKTLCS